MQRWGAVDMGNQPGERVVAFVYKAGLVSPGCAPRFTALTGGVASDIWKVEGDGRVFAVKQALPQLRVARNWSAPVCRNESEVQWMKLVNAVAPSIAPEVFAHDADVGVFAMQYFDPDAFPVWKHLLASGRVDPRFAADVGAAIARIHTATAYSEAVARDFDNGEVFRAIRLEPYFEEAGRAHADLAPLLSRLSVGVLTSRIALMHGDVSPKNILAGRNGPVLLDAECACYGDPAFDLAFCLSHLLLKCIMVPRASDRFLASFDALKDSYLRLAGWEPGEAVEARASRLLPALLLARIDGKSPVEYITAKPDKDRVRRVGRFLLLEPAHNLADVRTAWRKGVVHA